MNNILKNTIYTFGGLIVVGCLLALVGMLFQVGLQAWSETICQLKGHTDMYCFSQYEGGPQFYSN